MLESIGGFPEAPITMVGQPMDFSGTTELGLYASSTTQRHACGRRALGPDGSVYRYCKATTALTSTSLGASTLNSGEAVVAYEALGYANAIGDMKMILPQGSITKNQVAGGWVVVHRAAGAAIIRRVVANDATVGSYTTIYLDSPIDVALTTSDYYDLYPNVYADTDQANHGGALPFLGVPLTIAAINAFYWLRTYGPVFIACQDGVGGTLSGRQVYWRHDGSIDILGDVAAYDYVTDQIAGYCLIGSKAGDGPIIMLQCGI